jgi:hypothetical protein
VAQWSVLVMPFAFVCVFAFAFYFPHLILPRLTKKHPQTMNNSNNIEMGSFVLDVDREKKGEGRGKE